MREAAAPRGSSGAAAVLNAAGMRLRIAGSGGALHPRGALRALRCRLSSACIEHSALVCGCRAAPHGSHLQHCRLLLQPQLQLCGSSGAAAAPNAAGMHLRIANSDGALHPRGALQALNCRLSSAYILHSAPVRGCRTALHGLHLQHCWHCFPLLRGSSGAAAVLNAAGMHLRIAGSDGALHPQGALQALNCRLSSAYILHSAPVCGCRTAPHGSHLQPCLLLQPRL